MKSFISVKNTVQRLNSTLFNIYITNKLKN